MLTETPVMDLRVGDRLGLDSGNYIVTIEHICLVRGVEVEIFYRFKRSFEAHKLTVSKFATLPKV